MSSVIALLLMTATARGAGSRVAIHDQRDLIDKGIIETPMVFATRLNYMK
jgi:hypothetical protein